MLISAFSLVMPYSQSRRDELQCDTLCQGSMTSARSTLSLIGSALMGRLSDSFTSSNNNSKSNTFIVSNGRILCLYIGTLAALAGFVIDASMYSIRGMWLGMVPGALLQQNFSVFKAMLADYHEEITVLETKLEKEQGGGGGNGRTSANEPQDSSDNYNNDKDKRSESNSASEKKSSAAAARAGSVGKLGMSVGLAFMVGPFFGATMVKSYQSAVSFACCLTILSMVWIMKMPLPVSLPQSSSSITENGHGNEDNKKNENLNDSQKLWSSLKQKITNMVDVKSARTKPAVLLIVIRLCMALAFHIFNTIWTVSLKRRFNFGPKDHGKFMSYIGLLFALSQGFLAKRIIGNNRKGRVNVILCCCLFLAMCRVVAFQVNDLRVVYIMFGFIVTSLGVVNTIFTADTCLIAPSSEIGSIYGVLEASQSAAGMVGPFLGGVLAQFHPVRAPLTAVVALYAFVFILVLTSYEKLVLRQDHKKKKEV